MQVEIETLAEGFAFLEGPRWHDGALYASDMFNRRVLRFGSEGQHEVVCEVPGQPSGLGWDPEGNLLVSSMIDKRVMRLRAGQLTVVADLAEEAAGHINDMLAGPTGRLYVGNFGSDLDGGELLRAARLILVEPDGAARAVGEGLVFPNGMAITADGKTLIVAETFAFCISAFDIEDDGELGQKRAWASLGPYPAELTTTLAAVEAGLPMPDGLCIDAEGGLWVADAGGAGVLRVVEGVGVVDRIEVPGLSVYAVALGGDDLRTLYMCAAPKLGTYDPRADREGKLLACRVEIPGVAS